MIPLNTIHCMDCLEGMKQIENKSIDLVITDPPYNVMINDDIKIKDKVLVRRSAEFDNTKLDIPVIISNFNRILKDGRSLIIFCSDHQLGEYINEIEKNGLYYSNTLVWVKNSAPPKFRKNSFINLSEYIAFAHKETNGIKYTFNFKEQGEMGNVLYFEPCVSFSYGKAVNGTVGEATGHPTQKPSKLIQHLIEITSNEGDVILDPFMGSGTTAIAAIRSGRQFIGFERERSYFDAAQIRIKKAQEQGKITGWFE